MRLSISYLAVAFFLSSAVMQNSPSVAKIDPAYAAKVFAEAKQCNDRDGGHLWGVSVYGPMMFVDRETHEIVANRPAPEGGLKEVGGVYVGRLPDSVGIANTAIEWAGVRWSMVMWPLPDKQYPRERLLMHESFHRIQPQIGLQLGNPSNAHLDSEQGRVWLRLEWHALRKALMADGEDRKAAIRDALVFRGYRREMFPNSATEERALEMNEGLAEYTGVKLAAHSMKFAIEAASNQIENNDGGSSFTRSFAYTSGPAYGLLLDESGVDWRKGLTPQADIGALLLKAYSLSLPADLKSAAKEQAARYEGDSVIAEERLKAEKHRKVLADFRARLVDGPVLVLPASGNVDYSFDPTNLIILDESKTVYPTLTVRDDWGRLEVTAGALMVRGKSGIERFQVAAPGDWRSTPITGEGWTLELANGWEIRQGIRSGDYIVVKTK